MHHRSSLLAEHGCCVECIALGAMSLAGTRAACTVALRYGFPSIVVRPDWLGAALETLAGSSVMPVCVIGYPRRDDISSREHEARVAWVDRVSGGQTVGIEVHLPHKTLRTDPSELRAQLEDLVEMAGGCPITVVLGVHRLTPDELLQACELVRDAGAWGVKTRLGVRGDPRKVASCEVVAAMRAAVGDGFRVTVGGVGDGTQAQALLRAGASCVSVPVELVTRGRV